MQPTIEAEVIAILARQAVMDPAAIGPDMSPADLGLDSIGIVQTIFAIEETFDISVPFNANLPEGGAFDLGSVRSIVEGVERLIAEQA